MIKKIILLFILLLYGCKIDKNENRKINDSIVYINYKSIITELKTNPNTLELNYFSGNLSLSRLPLKQLFFLEIKYNSIIAGNKDNNDFFELESQSENLTIQKFDKNIFKFYITDSLISNKIIYDVYRVCSEKRIIYPKAFENIDTVDRVLFFQRTEALE